jgi:hypothetical protein
MSLRSQLTVMNAGMRERDIHNQRGRRLDRTSHNELHASVGILDVEFLVP